MNAHVMTLSRAAFADFERQMLGEILPFWSSVGLDGEYGFIERADFQGRAVDPGFKRLRVQARQVAVFAQASLVGVPGAFAAAECGWRFMLQYGWDTTRGWASRLRRDGAVMNAGPDLYDIAFALYALGWWVRASGDRSALDVAHRTIQQLSALRVGDLPGWRWHLAADDRAQNPHMHLFEALILLHKVAPDAIFVDALAEIMALLQHHLIDPDHGVLREYFGPQWQPSPLAQVEPGHHCEWAWLLHQAPLLAPMQPHLGARLFAFADRHGWDRQHGLMVNVLDVAGGVPDSTAPDSKVPAGGFRLWPQCEALKAMTIQPDQTRWDAPMAALIGQLRAVFLNTPTPGLWVDRCDAALRPMVDHVPASALYHLWEAYAALAPVFCRHMGAR